MIQEHRKKLIALESVINKRKQEEEALINKAVQLTTAATEITSLQTNGPVHHEYSIEDLESMRDQLKASLQKHANSMKFLVNSKQTLSPSLVDTVCEAYFKDQ